MIKRILFLISILICFVMPQILIPFIVWGAPVIPGVYGWGTNWSMADAPGPGDPDICMVTSTGTSIGAPSSSTRNGVDVYEGTFIQCLEGLDSGSGESANGKYIFFETSGVIHQTGSGYSYTVDNDYTMILGQTAPDPGITLRNITLIVRTPYVVVRGLKMRVGDDKNGPDPDSRANFKIVNSEKDVHDVVVYQNSLSWGVDINALFGYEDQTLYPNNDVYDITIANNLIYEGLHGSLHSKGDHSKGASINTSGGGAVLENIFIANNIVALNVGRNMLMKGMKGIYVNNLHWGNDNANVVPSVSQGAGDSEIDVTHNLMMFSARNEFFEINGGMNTNNKIYLAYNEIDNDGTNEDHIQTSASDWGTYNDTVRIYGNWTGHSCDTDTSKTINTSTEWECARDILRETNMIHTYPSNFKPEKNLNILKRRLISNTSYGAGAIPKSRDYEDSRVIEYIVKESGGEIIDEISYTINPDCNYAGDPIACCSGNNTGDCVANASDGWGNLADIENTKTHNDIPSSPFIDTDGDGYTNLEEWANGTANQIIHHDRLPTGMYHAGVSSEGPLAGGLQTITNTDISFTNNGDADTINSASNEFGNFQDGDTVYIESTSGTNDKYCLVETVAGDYSNLTMEENCSLTTENAITAGTVTIKECPTFYIINTLSYDSAMTPTTRNGYPLYEGGYLNFWTWNKDNKWLLTEKTGTIDGSNDRIAANEEFLWSDVSKGNYVAASFQTAPVYNSDYAGLLVKGSQLDIEGLDVVIQHHRSMVGKLSSDRDNLNLYGTRNICYQCTLAWGDDEDGNVGMYTWEDRNRVEPQNGEETTASSGTTGTTLIVNNQEFNSRVFVGDYVENTTDNLSTTVVSVESNTELTLADAIFDVGDSYIIWRKEGLAIDNGYLRTIFAEGYRYSGYGDENYESKGTIVGAAEAGYTLLWKNWWHSNFHRNPLFQSNDGPGQETGGVSIGVNNYSYNAGDYGPTVNEIIQYGYWNLDWVGNITEEGPDTRAAIDDKFISFSGGTVGINIDTDIYFYDNCAVDSGVWNCQTDVNDWNEIENYIDGKANDSSTSSSKWLESDNGINEYYITVSSEEDPKIAENTGLELENISQNNGDVGSLNDHNWDYGDNENTPLGYNTVYFRDDSGDPDITDVNIDLKYTDAKLEEHNKSTSEVVGITWTPDSANDSLKTNIITYGGSFPAFRITEEERWKTEADSDGLSGDIPLTALSYPTLTETTHNIGTDLSSDYYNFPSDPWADTNWCSGNTAVCNAGDGRVNVLEWLDGRDYYVIYGTYPSSGDVTPPVISNPLPSETQSCTVDPQNIYISITTDENATCKYDTSDTTYDLMSNTFSTTGNTSHSQTLTLLPCDASYTYYTRCEDIESNQNDTSTSISFSIEIFKPAIKGVSFSSGGINFP